MIKIKKKMINLLNNLGDYSEIYKDNVESKSINDAIYIRYKNREKRIILILKYLINSTLHIKNNKYNNILTADKIRPQFRYLFDYKDETKIFNEVYQCIKPYYMVVKDISGLKNSEYLNTNQSSSLIHYLYLLSIEQILQLFIDKLNTSGGGNDSGWVADSTGHDQLHANSQQLLISGNGTQRQFNGFASISVDAIHGGTDTAFFSGTDNRDTFLTEGNTAYAWGADYNVGILGF